MQRNPILVLWLGPLWLALASSELDRFLNLLLAVTRAKYNNVRGMCLGCLSMRWMQGTMILAADRAGGPGCIVT